MKILGIKLYQHAALVPAGWWPGALPAEGSSVWGLRGCLRPCSNSSPGSCSRTTPLCSFLKNKQKAKQTNPASPHNCHSFCPTSATGRSRILGSEG